MGHHKTTARSPRRPRAERAGTPWLRVTAGAHCDEIYALDEGEWIIGKDPEARIRLSDSGVSRRHAKLVRSSDDLVVIIDLQSTNGTYVNESRIETMTLRPGHRVGIGPDAELEFGRGEPPVSEGRPKPDEKKNPLTRRELEVAGLVAQGLTNRQIAETLSIKPSTVSNHLDNIYGRLDISSRAALTRWVLESGL